MILHLCEQRSKEWKEARKGRITASESGPFILNSGKVADGAKQKLIDKKLAEWAGEFEETFQNDAMKRGTALEPIAREQYRIMLQMPVMEVGFISNDTLPLGCSPDAVVLSRQLMAEDTAESIGNLIVGGCEIKAPQGSTQIRYLRDGVLPEEYKFQVHHSMVQAKAPWWDFYSFCPLVTRWTKTRDMWMCDEWQNNPKIPAFYVRTYRDAFTEQLAQGLADIAEELERQKAWLASL